MNENIDEYKELFALAPWGDSVGSVLEVRGTAWPGTRTTLTFLFVLSFYDEKKNVSFFLRGEQNCVTPLNIIQSHKICSVGTDIISKEFRRVFSS